MDIFFLPFHSYSFILYPYLKRGRVFCLFVMIVQSLPPPPLPPTRLGHSGVRTRMASWMGLYLEFMPLSVFAADQMSKLAASLRGLGKQRSLQSLAKFTLPTVKKMILSNPPFPIDPIDFPFPC